MNERYLQAAMRRAKYEKTEGGQFFATIPHFDGLWAVGNTRKEAERELRESLIGWLDVHVNISKHQPPRV